MRKQYKYSNLNKETNTSGKVTLELMKQRKIKTKPRKSKTLRQLMLEGFDKINKRLDENDKHWQHQEEFNKKIINRIDNLVSLNKLKEK